MKSVSHALVAAAVLVTGIAIPASAGIVVYDKDGKKIEVGGRIQLQYRQEDPDGGSSSDELFFRRLRPYISGTVTENWNGKIQFDFGKADGSNEVAVKDAYMQYTGWNNHKVTIGNSKTPFSREFLTSSKRQQTVERTFSGDHNFGSPDRQLGVRIDGHNESKKVSYSVALGSESIDPDASKLDFDSPANKSSDWNEGIVTAARIDFHPKGFMKFDQADFRSDEWKYNLSVSLFNWSNDDDNNTYTDAMGMSLDPGKADVDSADGVEVSAGVRGNGFSADVAFQQLSAETVDPTFTGGIYLNGMSDLDIYSFEAGYMVGKKVEIVAAIDSLDADNYAESYDRTSFGLNYYFNKHKTKFQLTYRQSDNVDGVDGVELDEMYGQFQFVF